MPTFKEKVFQDLGKVETLTETALLTTERQNIAIRSAFINLYQAVLVPKRFIQECEIDDPEGQKEADLTQAKDFYQTAIAKHHETRQKGGLMRNDLQKFVTHPQSMSSSRLPMCPKEMRMNMISPLKKCVFLIEILLSNRKK